MFLLCISSLKQPSRSVTASWTSTNTEKHLSDSRKDKVDGIVTPTQAARSWAQTYELFFSVKIYELVCVLGYAFVFMSVCVCACTDPWEVRNFWTATVLLPVCWDWKNQTGTDVLVTIYSTNSIMYMRMTL